jgi:hypothetical protein
MLYYDTVHYNFNIFYHYYLKKRNKKISIGYIPVGIDFNYRKYNVSTIHIMSLLSSISDKQAYSLKNYINIHPKDWYDKNLLNNKLMYNVQKHIALFSDDS